MKKTKSILIISIVLFSFSWFRIIWQAITKMPPSDKMTYQTGNKKNWIDKGYPYTRYYRFIDGSYVWMFSIYEKYSKSKKAGFIRFNLKTGIADMKWQLPGKSRYGRILGFAKNTKGQIAVLWHEHMGKARLEIILPNGGFKKQGFVPSVKKLNLKIIGFAWVDGKIEIAKSSYKNRITYIYRNIDQNKWQKRKIKWAGNYHFRTVPNLAIYKKGKWETIFTQWKLKKNNKPYPALVFKYRDKDIITKKIGTVKIQSHEIFNLIDGAPGNMIFGLNYNRKVYQFKQNKIRIIKPGDIASKLKKVELDTFKNTYILNQNYLERQLIWKSRFNQDLVIQTGKKEIKIFYKRSSKARNIRKAMFVMGKNKPSNESVVESFRFRGSYPVLIPAKDKGIWILGTFGYYIKLDKDLKRTEAPCFFKRYSKVIAEFGSRSAHYDDFYLDAALLKKLAMPVLHFLLPLFWLIVYCIHFFIKQNKQNEKNKLLKNLQKVSLAYIIIWLGYIYLFWKITINF